MAKNTFALVAMAIILLTVSLRGEKLYVFYPNEIRPKIIRRQLSEACPGIEITVFGRYKDFKAKVIWDSPDAIITKTPLIKQLEGYNIRFNGIRDSKTNEHYVLLSIEKPIALPDLSTHYIGTVDFLGRKEMKGFVENILSRPAKIKRVTKLEDLLPLMTFKMAEGILITEKEVEYFEEISKLNFVRTKLKNIGTGIVALATHKGSKARVVMEALKKIPEKTNMLLGIQEWK
ncbi:MAG: hypothetical protein GY765_39235 [bacterium]|nr:hypothetical protein [bacterium]